MGCNSMSIIEVGPPSSGDFSSMIQSITVSTDLGRKNINELGRRGPYFRFVDFPVEVREKIKLLTKEKDDIGDDNE